jgi:hypothetical protein
MENQLPLRPDLRQSLCHTLLAASFVLVGVLNPFTSGDAEARFHMWMMAVLVAAVIVSWWVMIRRWLKWIILPEEIRTVQNHGARFDLGRAGSHALMSALALLLTLFAFLGRAVIPDGEEDLFDEILFCMATAIALVSTAVLSGSIRDLFFQARHSKNK